MAKLVLALDLTDGDRALGIAEDVSDYISAIKVNYPLVLSAGIEIIDELSRIKPVIADFKIADIPYTSSLIAEIAFKNGASAVIVHGFAGRETVKAILDVATNYGGEVYIVTELTSSTEYFSGVSNKIAEMARELGCHGIIAPGTRPKRVRELREIVKDLKILCPGIGVQGGDVRRVVEAGADYIIVGRSIYGSKNPKKSAKEILKLLKP
jgi:orotidine-5'-phosphate decarboxylase